MSFCSFTIFPLCLERVELREREFMWDYSLPFQSLGLIVKIVHVCQFVGHSLPFFKCFSGFCSDLTLKSFIS